MFGSSIVISAAVGQEPFPYSISKVPSALYKLSLPRQFQLGMPKNISTSPSFCDLPPQVMFLHGLLEDFLMCTTVCRSSRMGFMHSLANSTPCLLDGFNRLDTYESQLGRMTSDILFFPFHIFMENNHSCSKPPTRYLVSSLNHSLEIRRKHFTL